MSFERARLVESNVKKFSCGLIVGVRYRFAKIEKLLGE